MTVNELLQMLADLLAEGKITADMYVQCYNYHGECGTPEPSVWYRRNKQPLLIL